MAETPRYQLPLLAAGQAQKEITHNEALVALDALLGLAVQSRGLAVPPASLVTGAAWLVADSASGAWAAQDGQIAVWTGGGWRFHTPVLGQCLYVLDEARMLVRAGTGWHEGGWPVGALHVNGLQVIGARRPAIANPAAGSVVDVEARTAIAALLDALRQHGLIAS
jgi:hypothetical protein